MLLLKSIIQLHYVQYVNITFLSMVQILSLVTDQLPLAKNLII